MPDSLFVRDGDHVVPTELSRSPWSPHSLHGGPVAALLAHALESLPTTQPMFPSRFTLELLRPVGLAPMRIDTRVVRPGRKVQVLEAVLSTVPSSRPDGDMSTPTAVARATLQQVASAAVELPDGIATVNGPETQRPPAPEDLPARDASIGDEGVRFHNTAVEHRSDEDFFRDPGPTQDWIKVLHDLFPGQPLTPLQRVVAAADFGNGVSSVLPFGEYLFVNPDLTVHLNRLPVDEWVCLDAVTRIDPTPGAGSVGLAESALFDRDGRIGRSLQSLLVEKL
jgi:hypothetical protein